MTLHAGEKSCAPPHQYTGAKTEVAQSKAIVLTRQICILLLQHSGSWLKR